MLDNGAASRRFAYQRYRLTLTGHMTISYWHFSSGSVLLGSNNSLEPFPINYWMCIVPASTAEDSELELIQRGRHRRQTPENSLSVLIGLFLYMNSNFGNRLWLIGGFATKVKVLTMRKVFSWVWRRHGGTTMGRHCEVKWRNRAEIYIYTDSSVKILTLTSQVKIRSVDMVDICLSTDLIRSWCTFSSFLNIFGF